MKLLQHRGWLMVGLTVLFILGVRVHLREMPLERDEGEYAYAGQLILHGVAPYKEAYNMKLPGTYAAYALIMAVFGQTPSGIHFGLALVNVGCVVLLFLVGRQLLDETAGAVAATVFGLLSTSPTILGLAGHATHFVVLPALAGLLFLLKSPSSDAPGVPRPTRALFLSGLFLGLAFLMKQQGVFFGLFGLLYVVFYRLYEPKAFKARIEAAKRAKSKSYNRKAQGETSDERVNLVEEGDENSDEPAVSKTAQVAAIPRRSATTAAFNPWSAKIPPIAWGTLKKELAIFAGGLALPYVAICILLACAGAFPQFVFWTITYAKEYALATPLVNAASLFKEALKAVVGPNFLLWLLPCVGMVVMWWDHRLGGRERFFLMAFLFCSLASTAVGLYFRAHYFITLLPALALLAGEATSRAVRLLKHDNTIELFLALPILALAFFGVLACVIGNGSVWFRPAGDALRTIYSTTMFTEALPIGNYIRTNSTPQTRVAVLGSEPEMYFYSRRKGATGYIYTYPLMEDQPFARKMQQEMIGEIERNKPGYVVFVDQPMSWLATTNSEKLIYEWWKGYWSSNLDLVKTFEIIDEPEEGPTNTHQILVLKRRAKAP